MNLPRTLEWIDDVSASGGVGHLRLLDQTRLPNEVAYLDCRTVGQVWDAIKRLVVRGAPAIGVAAAYGCVVGVLPPLPLGEGGGASPPGEGTGAFTVGSVACGGRASPHPGPLPKGEGVRARLLATADHLATSRPTAVNLFWALDRMKRVTPCTPDALLAEARAIHAEDAAMCRRIGEHGVRLIESLAGRSPLPGVLTHCNAGALATAGIGTATAPMYVAHERSLPLRVFADETRPLLQGARLTAWELLAAGIDVTLICDDMAAHVMRRGDIGLVIVGADRIAANGDTANKIGTYNVAILARHHKIPFYVAAPASTFDLSIPSGEHIPIEERAAEEITEGFGRRTAPAGIKTCSPAFDVTPADLITGIITDRGIISPVDARAVRAMLA